MGEINRSSHLSSWPEPLASTMLLQCTMDTKLANSFVTVQAAVAPHQVCTSWSEYNDINCHIIHLRNRINHNIISTIMMAPCPVDKVLSSKPHHGMEEMGRSSYITASLHPGAMGTRQYGNHSNGTGISS